MTRPFAWVCSLILWLGLRINWLVLTVWISLLLDLLDCCWWHYRIHASKFFKTKEGIFLPLVFFFLFFFPAEKNAFLTWMWTLTYLLISRRWLYINMCIPMYVCMYVCICTSTCLNQSNQRWKVTLRCQGLV